MTEVLVMRFTRCGIAVASDCAVRCSVRCSFHAVRFVLWMKEKTKEECISWVKATWASVSKETVIRSFKCGGLINHGC